MATFDGTLADGVLLEVAVEPRSRRAPKKLVRFAQDPAASFGDLFGRAVPGQTVDAAR